MDKKTGEQKQDGQPYVWQGYTGKVELVSFKTFLTKPVRRVALGADHSLILTYDDCLFACGSNEHGQLGCPNLGREYSFDPCLVSSISGSDIQHISCGTSHSACVMSAGSLFVWGDNQHGQCALNPSDQTEVTSPSEVKLSLPGTECSHGVAYPSKIEPALKIACGAAHNVALSVKGKIWVWGKGSALGLGAIQQSWNPVVLDKFSDMSVIDICSGDYHNLVLVAEGKHKPSPMEKSSSDSVECKLDVNNKCDKCRVMYNVENNDAKEVFTEHKLHDKVELGEIDVKVDKSVDDDVDATRKNISEDGQQIGSVNDDKQEAKSDSTESVKEEKLPSDDSNIDDEKVELRSKSNSTVQTLEELFTASTRSDSSISSSFSGKVSRSKSFLDDTGAREFLARQFQDEDVESSSRKLAKTPGNLETPASNAPSSPRAYMMQTVSTLTSHVSSMTTKALSNIASVTVPAKFKFTSPSGEEESRSSTENISENSDLDTGSTENISKTLDKSVLDFSNLTVSDASLNDSQLSLPDSEKSADGDEIWLPQSPVRGKVPSTRKSVSKESLSLRTIEAKQENLKRKSLSFLPSDEKIADKEIRDRYTLNTEIWTWGKNSKGQLGLGDMLERTEPYCLQFLSGRRIVKLACGALHTLALSSTGEVYSWGLNDYGQLGHGEICSTPARLEITSDCCIWCLDAGSNHSVFLVDNAGTLGTRPDVFYTGKHPCKDLYVPIYKTQKLTPLKFLKKSGWVVSVATGGDNCSCIARQESSDTQMVFELTRHLREMHRHTHKITLDFVKRMQISGYITGLEVQPYKTMIDNLLSGFTELSDKIGSVSVNLTDRLQSGDSVLGASLFTKYEDFVADMKKYSTLYEDMVAAGGFEYCVKGGSSLFETLQEFYLQLLAGTKYEAKPDHSQKFRQIMYLPLDHVKTLSSILSRYSELYEKSSRESNLLSSLHLNLEHFIRTSQTAICDADNTRMFWESSASKISDSLRCPTRRLMKESRSCPLALQNAGRFSSHVFYLFNDIFIHAQYSSYQSYPLATVWIDLPSSESSSSHNLITVTTPEETLSLNTTSSQLKVEWAVAFNTAINKVLASQKSVNRQNSGERIHTPVIRLAPHTFTKHTLFKDATYKGYWLNGKVHGSGIMKWSDGRKYKGKFNHGSITGQGIMLVPRDNDGQDVQEGVWKDGRLHGHGQIKYCNGDLYEGYFKEGFRHGHGVYRKGRYLSSASFVYVGEWLFDKKHGYGVMDDILKGEKYMGMWQEDNCHGDGVVVTLDGMYFEGNFQHNKLVGHGLMLTDDNSCYEGEFAGITMLQGKGCLTFPSGDKIDGTFTGTWNQGLKLSGVFHKLPMSASMTMKHSWTRITMESKSSLFGKLCVRPERKWEEIFYQCYECLHQSADREPNTHKAWDKVVASIVAGKLNLKEKDKIAMKSKQKLELSNLEQLEKVPAHSEDILTIEHMAEIVQYLNKACETYAHPLGKLVKDLVDVFRAAYIGIGAHPRLLYHAVQEIQSFIRRIYRVIRILFPELPGDGGPSHIYPERKKRASTPMKENMGFIQRQISEAEDEAPAEVVSSPGILQPILLPKIYPALFDLYALHSDREDERYWDRMQKLNKQGDISLMAYLGIDQSFWCLNKCMFENTNVRISSIRDHSYSKAVDVLQQISTAFCPVDKLEVIQRTFLCISESVQEHNGDDHVLCMDDLFPIFQFVVIRARIHHLGAEIHFIEELMESYLEFGELGIMFTTLKACYYQIQNEKMPIH